MIIMPVKKGDKIKVEYTGTFDDGTVFDSTEKHNNQPLEFEVGAQQVIKGFDEAVVGMEKDEEKEIKIPSAEAYGEPKPELIKRTCKGKYNASKRIRSNCACRKANDGYN